MILVVGAGAIGQWMAAILSLRAGQNVTLVARPRQWDELKHGIQFGQERAAVELCLVPPQREYRDLILAVKAFQVEEAAAALQAAGVRAERVWGFQNGVGTDSQLAAAFPQSWYGALTTTSPIGFDHAGQLQPPTRGGFGWAAQHDPGRAPAWLSQLGHASYAVPTIESLKWSKLLLNLTCNASCALLDMLPGPIVDHRPMFAAELRCLREALRAIRQARIALVDLPLYPVRAFAKLAALPDFVVRQVLGSKIKKARGQKAPSLLLDIRNGRRQSEVDVLNGAVVELARHQGWEATTNRWLCERLNQVLQAPEQWDQFRGKIDDVAQQALAASGRKTFR